MSSKNQKQIQEKLSGITNEFLSAIVEVMKIINPSTSEERLAYLEEIDVTLLAVILKLIGIAQRTFLPHVKSELATRLLIAGTELQRPADETNLSTNKNLIH